MSKQRGVSLQTSFMFMAVGIVPILVSTIALLPKSRIPWPLPADYGQGRHSGYSKDDTSRDWHRRMSSFVLAMLSHTHYYCPANQE